MCIVCFHFWISNLTFVPVLKKSGSNNTQKRVFGDSTSKSIPSSYPSKHSWPLSFSKEKQSDAWSKNAILLSHWTRFSTSFRTVKIYFVRQKTLPKISDNFPMALRSKMLTRFHGNPYLHFSVFFGSIYVVSDNDNHNTWTCIRYQTLWNGYFLCHPMDDILRGGDFVTHSLTQSLRC